MKINLDRIDNNMAMMFLIAIITLPRTFMAIKLVFLFFYLISFSIQFYRKKKIYVNRNVFAFYTVIVSMGMIWSFIGYLNGGSLSGISDNFRLWGFWSICYSLVITMFLQRDSLLFFHKAIVISGILICVINAIGFCDLFYGIGIIPEFVLTEMDLRLGLHEGYMHLTTENISSLFFVVPYLVALQFRKDAGELNNWVTKLSMYLCILLAAISGRRALWLSVLMAPFIIIGLSFCFSNMKQIKAKLKNITYVMFFGGIMAIFFIATSDSLNIPTIEHLKEAFSAEDQRSIQKGYLIKSFFNYPLFGSGFGVGAGYQRSEARQWLYELTYHQLLFNFGIIGTLCIVILYSSSFYLIIKNFKKLVPNDIIPFCILVGVVSFAIASYSNPYFGSFDFLIYIAMVPFLASVKLVKRY